MAKENEEELDYTLPLSTMVKQSLEELHYQSQPLSASAPPLKSFRARDYEVGEGFSLKPAKLDDDISLVGKYVSKAVVPSKSLEEMEKLTRQALAVGSHAEWVLGSVVALMDANDVKGVVRAIDSINIAQRHNAGLLSRLLANLTNARRDQFIATSSLSSVAKASLNQLPIPMKSKLFDEKLSEVVSKDAETTSKQALVSLACKFKEDKSHKTNVKNWTMPSFRNESKKDNTKEGTSYNYKKGGSKDGKQKKFSKPSKGKK